MNLRAIAASPLLIYRLFFKKWANIQERKYLNFLKSSFQENGLKAGFYPELPSPKASLRNALVYTGFNIVKTIDADIVIAWQDKTKKDYSQLEKGINIRCTNIGKDFLDIEHHKVFGYGVEVNPKLFKGKILEKSNENGAHLAQIVEAPIEPKTGFVYQKLLDNRKGLFYIDIRPVIVGQEIPFCYLNYRLEGKRFSAKKIKAKLAETNSVLSADEQMNIIALCQKMGVDVAELDVIRHKSDGLIYVIDVNPTAFGPAHGLSFKNKILATKKYAESLIKLIKDNFGISV